MNGKELKALRIKKGWTQVQLSDKTGIPPGTIGRLESTGQDIKKVGMMAKFEEIFKNEENDKNVTKENNPLVNGENTPTQGINPDDATLLNQNDNSRQKLTLSDSGKRGSFYTPLPTKEDTAPPKTSVDILKWIDPNHIPIPVFDNTYGAETISELLSNDSYKPTVILLKGHLGCNAVVRHVDSAMNKHFPARCQLGIERLKTFKKRIEPGKPYIVVLEELTVTRYVFESDNRFILRSSDVELYPDMPVDKEEIIEMWRIRSLTPIPDQQLF